MLALAVTILVFAGVALIVGCNAASTGLFTSKPPTGERAVGLIVPLVGLAGGALFVVLGALLAGFAWGRGGAGVLRDSPVLSAVLLGLISAGVALAAFMAFVAWMEPLSFGEGLRGVRPLLGWAAGVGGPLLLGVVILFGVWTAPDWFRASPRVLTAQRVSCGVLMMLALGGYSAAGLVFGRPLIGRVLSGRAALANLSPAERAARERFRTTPVEELLGDELDLLPSDAPLSEVVKFFVGTSKDLNERCREMLVQRALCVPDVDAQLLKVMGSTPYLYRWGGAEFLRHADARYLAAHEHAWARALEAGIDATAEAMTVRPAWLSETFDLNPEPLELVRSLIGAAERFRGLDAHSRIGESLRGMATAANELTRDKKWDRLAGELQRAGYPVPPEGSP